MTCDVPKSLFETPRRISLSGCWKNVKGRGCGQNLGLIMQQSQDDVYTQSDSAHREIA